MVSEATIAFSYALRAAMTSSSCGDSVEPPFDVTGVLGGFAGRDDGALGLSVDDESQPARG